MAENIDEIAKLLGAKKVGIVDAGGGALGAMRLGHFYSERMAMRKALERQKNRQANWVLHLSIPMSQASLDKLTKLAENASSSDCQVSPMQIAAELLEAALAQCEPK